LTFLNRCIPAKNAFIFTLESKLSETAIVRA